MLKFLHPLLRIDQREVEFSRRGFTCSRPAIRERLEHVGRVFLEGYHAALEQSDQEQLAARLNQIGANHEGFAYEGAAMALALLDGISPGNEWERFSSFVAGPGKRHIYMLLVGAGWACARLPWLRRRIESVIRRFHPVLGWLAVDGYGFHEGYFHWQAELQPKVSKLSDSARHVFYQGLGRSLWFVGGADASSITQTISTFAPQFHDDAWSGVGLGCAYAGGMNRAELEELRRGAGCHRAALAQGAAFAAKARQFAKNQATHTELACTALCGMSTEQAAVLCDQIFNHIRSSLHPCPYQQWRELLQQSLAILSEIPMRDGPSGSVFQLATSKPN
jgi:hypothetical protein